MTGKLRDPFPPCRIASINALAATQSFYTLAETGTKVLPAICTTLTDPEEPVRKQGFKVARGFIDKLQQVGSIIQLPIRSFPSEDGPKVKCVLNVLLGVG